MAAWHGCRGRLAGRSRRAPFRQSRCWRSLYVLLPFDLMSASFLDTRVAIMLGLSGVCGGRSGTCCRAQPRRVVAAGLVTLFAVRMAVVAQAWTEHRRDLADLRSRHRRGSAWGRGLHDQRATGGGAGLLGRGAAQPAAIEQAARRLSSAGVAAHRARRVLAGAVRQSRAAADPPAAAPTPGWPARRTTSPPTPPL